MFKDLKENRFKELEESVLSMREQRGNREKMETMKLTNGRYESNHTHNYIKYNYINYSTQKGRDCQAGSKSKI